MKAFFHTWANVSRPEPWLVSQQRHVECLMNFLTIAPNGSQALHERRDGSPSATIILARNDERRDVKDPALDGWLEGEAIP